MKRLSKRDPGIIARGRMVNELICQHRRTKVDIKRLSGRLRLCAFRGPVTLHGKRPNGDLLTIDVTIARRPRIDL